MELSGFVKKVIPVRFDYKIATKSEGTRLSN